MSVPEPETDGLITAVPDPVLVVPEQTEGAAGVDLIAVPEAPADAPLVETGSSGRALTGYRRIAAILVAADALAIVATLFLLHLQGPGYLGLNRDMVLVLLVAPVVWVAVFHSFGLYAVRHLAAPEEFRRVFSATTLGVVVITVGSIWWEEALDRPTLALTWLVALVFELLARRIVRWHVGELRADGSLALRTLIVGTNEEAQAIRGALSQPVRGFVPLGFVSSSGSPSSSVPVVGTIDDLPELIRERGAECVFVASTSVSAADVFLVSRCCRLANIEMRVSANTREVLTSRVSVHQVEDLMVLAVRSAKLTGTQSALKRAFDLVISSIALVALSPLMAVIAIAVKLTSPGPVLFRQQRVTKDGRPFTVLKFRTMVTDPDRVLGDRMLDLSEPFFKMERDPRVTRVGAVLRSLSLDELPQLWNVIRGDMSLVGPRPLMVEQVEANHELLEPRHEVRAGVTGWWQINGRSEVDAQDALKMDLFYIENWSLALDVYVLLKTVGVVLGRKGAY
jgi:exopolysaccharide biosynthesis polyprenyl glycosylphosphotransferase